MALSSISCMELPASTMLSWQINSFWPSVQYAVNQLQLSVNLKPAQCRALWELFNGHDVFVILPTGYGKSLIYQLAVYMLGHKLNIKNPKLLVVTPLNAIVQDQASKLSSIGVQVGILRGHMTGSCPDHQSDEEEEEETNRISSTDVCIAGSTEEQLRKANIVYAHPEAVVSSRPYLLSDAIQNTVVATVVDEAHCIVEWGLDFRQDFAKLAILASLFPHTPTAAMTATAPQDYREAIIKSLCLKKPVIISRNPDRENIMYAVKSRLPSTHGVQSYYDILYPIAIKLLEERICYPSNIIYMKLKYCGYAHRLFENVLGVHQYYPETCAGPDHRLFGQYHAPQTEEMKQVLLKQLSSQNTCRVVFVTCAVGMGVDAPSIRHVVHIGVPHTMRAYFQETGH
ncbi:Bloom syndrome protein-like [Patiria miniata]|uniref:DNA 3'-5' helicase n=1 Tax=Patiria miniata TaxID=46514 RepID=A0A914A367_PATMI|nr:Bloom syndrome protein-like [Patiria miniata]